MRPRSGPLPARLRLGTVRPPSRPARGRPARKVLRIIRNARQIAVHGNCSCSLSPVLDPDQEVSRHGRKTDDCCSNKHLQDRGSIGRTIRLCLLLRPPTLSNLMWVTARKPFAGRGRNPTGALSMTCGQLVGSPVEFFWTNLTPTLAKAVTNAYLTPVDV